MGALGLYAAFSPGFSTTSVSPSPAVQVCMSFRRQVVRKALTSQP